MPTKPLEDDDIKRPENVDYDYLVNEKDIGSIFEKLVLIYYLFLFLLGPVFE